MEELFNGLAKAVEEAWWIGFCAAFVWGILSVVLSPCHLASIPLLVGYLNEQGNLSSRRACWLSSVFACGILATIALIGILTALLGDMAGDIGPWGGYLVGIVFVLVGLHFLDLLGNPLRGAKVSGVKTRGTRGALVLGLVFGVTLGPCTFAYMAPLLAAAFQIGAHHLAQAALLLLLYGVGHCLVIVVAGTCAEMVQHYLHWNERSRGAAWVKKGCGVLVILAGFYTLWKC